MEIIKVSNLHTAFGDNIVHNNISFSINEGKIFGVLGGSESRKSVLLNQIFMIKKKKKLQLKHLFLYIFQYLYYYFQLENL